MHTTLISQSEDCNKLGVWLWFIEQTGFDTHNLLSDSLSNMGVKRIYVKVADGSLDTNRWPEIINEDLVKAYHDNDIEVWAWSYNYPGNVTAQADALLTAAKTGYDGYVIDLEMEFDNSSFALTEIMEAFSASKIEAKDQGIIDDDYVMGVTTWGNPADHLFRIDILDNYVDAYFPQTYIENWGSSYLENPAFWIEVGNREYAELGATKPIHHIVSTEQNIISSEQLNEFIQYAGPESSIWRIPGGGTTTAIWRDWAGVDWEHNFCQTSNISDIDTYNISVYPNPSSDYLSISNPNNKVFTKYQLVDFLGRIIISSKEVNASIDIERIPTGNYILKLHTSDSILSYKIFKL